MTIEQLESQLHLAMLADQRPLRRMMQSLAHQGGGRDKELVAIADRAAASIARRARRAEARPSTRFPAELPITARKDDIARAMSENQVIIVCGETGSGKTTQLPKICLELGRGVGGLIGHTQPRRIAARAVAARIAEELGTPLGRVVGYKVRFNDKTSPDCYIKVMTDGILLAETQGEGGRLLEAYDTLIIDEAHERSLNIDFLLGYIRQLLPKRPDLKVIITSATIDPERFARHFAVSPQRSQRAQRREGEMGGSESEISDLKLQTGTQMGTDDTGGVVQAPIIEVSGRVYPVEVRYRPPVGDDGRPLDPEDASLEDLVLRAVDELAALPGGDVLVFLSGEREIREVAEALRKHHPPSTQILPLYARLTAAEQERVFQPHAGRRIVLATNVAETSLTVPGIRYVIDPGTARISRYSSRTKVQRLPIEPVSQASADQRKGRCGRIAEGVCIRLYSEDDYKSRPRFTEPEILRTNLASVILQMKSLGLGEVVDFPFVDPPESRFIRDGYDTLHELGAVDEQGQVTRIGRELARLPVDPRIGRMLLAASHEDSLTEVLVIGAALSIQDPRERPLDRQDAADIAHKRFAHDESDFMALLNLWRYYREQEAHLSHSKLRRLCRDGFLSFVRMREWDEVHRQLHGLVADMGYRPNARPALYDPIHRALLAGLLSSIGVKTDENDYKGCRGTRFSIFPGSVLHRKNPRWIMGAEIVQTTRLYARAVARIQPQWVERLARHLVSRQFFEPHWNSRLSRVDAFEKVTLLGLEVVPRRPIHYGPIDPKLSREIFIRHGLVEGDLHAPAPFIDHNRDLMNDVLRLEAKLRRRDLVADEHKREEFFNRRLGDGVYSSDTLLHWLRHAHRGNPDALCMSLPDMLRDDAAAALATPERFPMALELLPGARVPLAYRFEPGHADDGVTATIPLEAVGQVRERLAEWLVPGMLREKIIELLRLLPKPLRIKFVPAPAVADQILEGLAAADLPLTTALTERLLELTGVSVPDETWHPGELPAHLRMNFAIVDGEGRRVMAGRDLAAIRQQLEQRIREALASLPHARFRRDGITDWDFGDLPESVEVSAQGLKIRACPALVEVGSAVALRLVETVEQARRSTRAALRRLYLPHVARELEFQVRNLPGIERMRLNYATLGPAEELRTDLSLRIVERAFLAEDPPGDIRKEQQFRARLDEGWKRLSAAAHEVGGLADDILRAYQPIAAQLAAEKLPLAWLPALDDIREQLAYLLPRGFLASVPLDWLRHYPRYLAAIAARLRKLQAQGGIARDEKHAAMVRPFCHGWLALAGSRVSSGSAGAPDELELFRWMVEEFRVACFAQELGTAMPVSERRLQEQWGRVRR
jgi:ATP-dependent helicase HrpA